jgi:hypothetical protein
VSGSAVRAARRPADPRAGAQRQPPAAPPPNPGAQAIDGRACSRYALAAPREPGICPCTVRKGSSLSDIRFRWVAPWTWSRPERGRLRYGAPRGAERGARVASPRRGSASACARRGRRGPPPCGRHPSQPRPEQAHAGALGNPLPTGIPLPLGTQGRAWEPRTDLVCVRRAAPKHAGSCRTLYRTKGLPARSARCPSGRHAVLLVVLLLVLLED